MEPLYVNLLVLALCLLPLAIAARFGRRLRMGLVDLYLLGLLVCVAGVAISPREKQSEPDEAGMAPSDNSFGADVPQIAQKDSKRPLEIKLRTGRAHTPSFPPPHQLPVCGLVPGEVPPPLSAADPERLEAFRYR